MTNDFQPLMDNLRRAADEVKSSQTHVWQQFIDSCRRNDFSDDDICVEMRKLKFHVDDFYGIVKLLYDKCPVAIKCHLADRAACGQDGAAYSTVWRDINNS